MMKAVTQILLDVRERIRRNPVNWMVGGFLFGSGGYMLIWFGLGWWLARPIYPVENADGTIDYTLVTSIKNFPKYGDKERKERWVLRFPKDVPVYVPELDRYASSDVSVNGVNLGNNKAGNINIYIRYILRNSNFEYRTNEEFQDAAHVSITNTHLPYEIYHGEKLGVSFLWSSYRDYYINCEKDQELSPFFYSLKQSSELEIERKKIELQKFWIGSLTNIDNNQCITKHHREKYVIENNEGKPVAVVDCNTNKSCSMVFPSDQGRRISVKIYNQKYIPELRRLYELVISTLNKATVLSKSEIEWRPEQ